MTSDRALGELVPPATTAGRGEPTKFDPEPAPNETAKEWAARLIREGCRPPEWNRLVMAQLDASASQRQERSD